MVNVFQSIDTGQVTGIGTASAVQLGTDHHGIGSVTVRALSGNSGKVYVGNTSGVTTSTGYQLAAGESISMDIGDTSIVWLIADAASQGVTFVAVRMAPGA